MTTIGLYLLFCTFLLPVDQDLSTLSGGAWAALLEGVYMLGHLAQAITNPPIKMMYLLAWLYLWA
jgi:hypothetical protein